MLEIKVTGDFRQLERELRRFQKELPFATANALTQMGKAAKEATKKEIRRVFDKPTRWTQESTYLKPATKTRLRAEVWIKKGSLSSLSHHVTGGQRPAKGFEKQLRRKGIMRGSNQYAVPSMRVRLNSNGNMSRGKITKIVSSLGAHHEIGFSANTTSRSLQRNKGQGDYFVVTGQRRSGLPSGVYEAKGRGSNRDLLPVLIFVRNTRYRARYDFYAVTEDASYDAMPEAIDKAITQVMRRAGMVTR